VATLTRPHKRHAGESNKSLWSARLDDYSATSLACFLTFYFVSASWTAGLAIPSGSFSPTMLTGALAGRLFAHLLRAAGLVVQPDAPLYALLGTAAFFTGASLQACTFPCTRRYVSARLPNKHAWQTNDFWLNPQSVQPCHFLVCVLGVHAPHAWQDAYPAGRMMSSMPA
jgi:hypothetical protein